jgi:parallel beta-helix repeat protein
MYATLLGGAAVTALLARTSQAQSCSAPCFAQSALNVGVSVLLASDYAVWGLTVSASGVTICGPGRLVKLGTSNGRVLYVTGHRNRILGVRFTGTAAVPSPGALNDMIRIQGGSDNIIDGCYIDGSPGSGIRIDSGARNKVTNNTILNAYQNSILICNPGADDNFISGNYCKGTSTQNNIYITADDGAVPSGAAIYRNVVSGNHCDAAFDTGIESGYHAYYTSIIGNVCTGSSNPPILIRDGFGINVADNLVVNRPYASQPASYDGISVVPHHELASWNYSTRIQGNTILGAVTRAAIYVGGSHVVVDGNTVFDNTTAFNDSGSGLVGYGITLAGAVTDITITNNTVRRFERAVDLNQDGTAQTRTRIEVSDNHIRETAVAINGFNCTFIAGVIKNNRIKTVRNEALLLTSATVNGGLRYYGNAVDLSGFTSAAPVEINPESAVRAAGLLIDSDTKWLEVPEGQFDNVLIVAVGGQSMGICTIQFADGSELATFAVGGRSGFGTGTTSKLIGTANLLDSDGAAGSSGWSLFYDGSDQLQLQRRGGSTGAGPRYMKVKLHSAG